MIIGIDSHKASLSACVIDGFGRAVATAEVAIDPAGHRALLVQARRDSPEDRVFAIEGSGHHAYALARALLGAGELVLEIPPALAARERRRAGRGKSDPTDALAIARAAAREAERLVPLHDDPAARDLKLVSDFRAQLVAERTRTANRLHADLVQLAPGYQRAIAHLRGRSGIAAASRLLAGRRCVQADLARARLAALRRLDREIAAATARLGELVAASGTSLTEVSGVGVICAARIIGEVRDVRRFPNRDRFAAANGTAPIPASSGPKVRHRLNRGGNRRLNWAIHLVALSQAAHDPRGRAYPGPPARRGPHRP